MISSQMESEERLLWTFNVGRALFWDPANACYVDSLPQDPKRILEKLKRYPRIVR